MTQLAFGTVAPTSRRAVAYIIDAAIAAGIAIVLGILLAIFATIAGPTGCCPSSASAHPWCGW